MADPIDRAYVEIHPDFSRFNRGMRDGLNRISRQIEQRLKQPFDNVEKSVADSGKRIEENANRSFGRYADAAETHSDRARQHITKASTDTNRAIRDDLARSRTDIIRSHERIGERVVAATQRVRESYQGVSSQVRTTSREVERDNDRITRSLNRVRDAFTGIDISLGRGGRRVVLLGSLITLAVFGVAAAVGDLLSLLLPVPAAIAVLGAAIGTLAVALRGMGDAFSAAFGDAEAFEEAIADLAPAAQNAAREFRAIAPALSSIRPQVQQAFWEQLDGAITSVANNLMGPFRTGMTIAAVQMGRVAEQIGVFASSELAARTVGEVFRALASIMRDLAGATKPFLDGLAILIRIYLPGIAAMAENADKAALSFRNWARRMDETGEGLERVRSAGEFLGTLFGIIRQGARLIEAAVQAANDAGVDLFETIRELLSAAADLAETPRGQSGLQQFFLALDRIVRALLPVLGEAAVQIGRLATPIAEIAERIGPGLTRVLQGIGDALVGLIEGGGAAFLEALANALGEVADHLGPLGEALGGLLEAISPILEPLGRLLGLVIDIVTAIIELFTPAIENLAEGLAMILTPVVDGLSIAFEWLRGAIETVYNWIKDNLIPVIMDELWPVIENELIPVLQELWGEIQEVAKEIWNLWLEIKELIDNLIKELFPELDWWQVLLGLVQLAVMVVIYAIRAVIGVIKLWMAVSKPQLEMLRRVTAAIRTVNDNWNVFKGAVQSAFGVMKQIIDRGVRLMATFRNITAAVKNLSSSIRNIPNIPNITGGLGGMLGRFFADGGIVTGPTRAVVGEAGPEVIIPLTQPRRAQELVEQSGLMNLLSANATPVSRSPMNTVTTSGVDAGIVVERGAVNIVFNGVPNETQAKRVGNAAAEGLLNTLAARNARRLVRGL